MLQYMNAYSPTPSVYRLTPPFPDGGCSTTITNMRMAPPFLL